ncbi:c-type cytochrome [bacterium]|nr:c-type cytochrome [bacterium]
MKTLIFLGLAVSFFLCSQLKADEKKLPEGQKIFLKYGCNECHTVLAASIGKSDKKSTDDEEEAAEKENEAIKPPDLSNIGNEKKGEWVDLYLRKKEAIEGRKHKKRFKGNKEEKTTLVEWLGTLKTVPEVKDTKTDGKKAK